VVVWVFPLEEARLEGKKRRISRDQAEGENAKGQTGTLCEGLGEGHLEFRKQGVRILSLPSDNNAFQRGRIRNPIPEGGVTVGESLKQGTGSGP